MDGVMGEETNTETKKLYATLLKNGIEITQKMRLCPGPYIPEPGTGLQLVGAGGHGVENPFKNKGYQHTEQSNQD